MFLVYALLSNDYNASPMKSVKFDPHYIKMLELIVTKISMADYFTPLSIYKISTQSDYLLLPPIYAKLGKCRDLTCNPKNESNSA